MPAALGLMGATHSSSSGVAAGGTLMAREIKQLRMMAMLDRNDVARMIIEVNDAGLNLGGREVNVKVAGYSDDHLLWRSGIRFRCTVKDLQSGEELTKEINLRQFITVYHNVMVNKKLLNIPTTQQNGAKKEDSGQQTQLAELEGEEEDDHLCCVCLERERQISLPCAHSFCPSCIHEWQLRSNACPLCREESTVEDQWILEDGPDLTEMEKELKTTLVNLLRSF
ncbi:RING finger protein 141-like isoform X1 [Varroa jacobsoni]|uniref:RING finger protein 141 n=2 Tax=Varroa destructor TaxID=109461 RepID=A0A7M7KYW9_VARDE|nr:RING finger protein 141-like isoform X1 [Varroa destructor]XP_022671120.1 RING finger protein 141-like isoform X1 [Varroa destructor]XP_022696507.1 RING finger protein 141-like isoform X1 [Varroa jacobsoni]